MANALLAHWPVPVSEAGLPAEIEEKPFWTASFAAEIALRKYPVAEVCARHVVHPKDYEKIKLDPEFLAAVGAKGALAKKDGEDVRLASRGKSMSHVEKLDEMINDVGLPASVRADLLKFALEKMAGATVAPSSGTMPAGLTINLNLA